MPGRVLVGSIALLLVVGFYQGGVTAHHRWGKYHWARSANPLSLVVASNLDSGWTSSLSSAVSDWNASSVLSLSTASFSGDPVACAPTLGRINVCNASYGNNGWLGIAQIWIGSGSHIVQATTKVNDTYFDTPAYDSNAWRRFVMCQEVGHDFGLDHQDERFPNANIGTCMDYTDDPDGSVKGQLSNLAPNAHDFEELAAIYAHLDGGGSGGGGGGGGRGRGRTGGALPPQASDQAVGNSQRSWGQLIATNGRVARYVLDLGNGGLIFTFVIWA